MKKHLCAVLKKIFAEKGKMLDVVQKDKNVQKVKIPLCAVLRKIFVVKKEIQHVVWKERVVEGTLVVWRMQFVSMKKTEYVVR